MVIKYEIVWTKNAQLHIREVYEYIIKDSPESALKVVEDIVAEIYKTRTNPEIYTRDRFKKNNDGTYRSFEKHRYRVTYRVTKNIVRILWIRHTGRTPKIH